MTVEQNTDIYAFASGPPQQVASPHPPGVIAILCAETGVPFKEFVGSYRQLQVPTGSGELFLPNGEKVQSRNHAVAALLANPQLDFLWFMDNDHVFDADFLMRQLETCYREDFDVLGSLYLARLAPNETYPIGGIFFRENGHLRIRNLDWQDLPGWGTVLERRDLALGAAGLLIRRRAIEKLEPPYFRVGQLDPGKEHEDVEFAVRCQEAGLKVGMQVDQTLGHTMRTTIWAGRDSAGQWHVGLAADQRFKESQIPVPGRIIRPGLAPAPEVRR